MIPIISDLQEFAPAKINLSLYITGRRPDGWHLLHSLVAFCTIGDMIGWDPAGPPGIAITGPAAGLLEGEDISGNSVWRAAQAICRATGYQWTQGHLTLIKNLPVASGIGGGSTDAAATIRLLRRVWGLGENAANWHDLALGLGADVPVCLAARTAWMTGIGEQITPAFGLYGWPVLLVNPRKPLSTPAVFAVRSGTFSDPSKLTDSIPENRSMQRTWLHHQENDLTAAAAALVPDIAEILDFLYRQPELFATRMSGSGATCLALATEPASLNIVADRLRNWRSDLWIAAGKIL